MNETKGHMIESAPFLDIDYVLYKDRDMLPRTRRERRIVWNLLLHLGVDGFKPVFVYDGDEYVPVEDAKAAMEVIFNLDDAVLYVMKDRSTGKHAIKLVLGNDMDIISDWTYTQGDADKFNLVMEAFDVEMYA